MGLVVAIFQLVYFFVWPIALPIICVIVVAHRRSRFSTPVRLLFCFMLVGASAAWPAYAVATTPAWERFTLGITGSELGIYVFTFWALCATCLVVAVISLVRRSSRR